ncbi:MAG: oligosaccharide flippase family protein, partial [Acidimicrobiales bacterium]|nr:oligosaccharide flippase family protein [Acidimicrobiales bacterium]
MTQPDAIGTSQRTLFLTFRAALGGTTVTYLFNLFVLPFVLHRLGASLFGAWATVSTVLAIGGLADAGVRTEIIRRVADAHGARDPDALRRAVHQGVALLAALSGAVFVTGALAAPLLRSFAFPRGVRGYADADLETLIRVTLAILAVSLVANGYFAALRGVQRGDVESTAIATAVPAAAAATVLGVLAGWGLWALVVGSATQLAVQFLFQAIAARRLLPELRFGVGGLGNRAWQAYLGLSGLAFVSQISEVVDAQWDKLIISRYVGSAAVTSFQVGTSLVIQAKVLVVLPLAPMLVAIAELRHQDPDRLDALCRRLSRTSFVLGGAVFGAIFVFAPAFIRLWLGSEYTTAGDVARLFAVAGLCNLVSAPLGFRAFGEGLHGLAAIGSLVNIGI